MYRVVYRSFWPLYRMLSFGRVEDNEVRETLVYRTWYRNFGEISLVVWDTTLIQDTDTRFEYMYSQTDWGGGSI